MCVILIKEIVTCSDKGQKERAVFENWCLPNCQKLSLKNLFQYFSKIQFKEGSFF
jgi:hypothetical protein